MTKTIIALSRSAVYPGGIDMFALTLTAEQYSTAQQKLKEANIPFETEGTLPEKDGVELSYKVSPPATDGNVTVSVAVVKKPFYIFDSEIEGVVKKMLGLN